MKDYKYQIVKHTNEKGIPTIIAIGHYAGKAVKATAKCNPEDAFDYDKGVKLAESRCGLKIAKKKRKNAEKCYQIAKDNMIKAIARFNDMEVYLRDAIDQQLDAEDYLKETMTEY